MRHLNHLLLIMVTILIILPIGMNAHPVDRDQECLEDSTGCCVGLVATGNICEDGRSIFWKNRHVSASNQKPYFYQGSRYTFFGVGGNEGECRMGMNEKGLAIGNFDVYGPLENWEYISDGSSGSEDNDMKIPLGNFSTVAQTATWLANHAYYGYGRQWGIISREQGVGAVVAMDTQGHSNITWVNNSYVVVANAFYCDGDLDGDGTDTRAQELIKIILHTPTYSHIPITLHWQDVCQILAKDTSDKEDGNDTFNYAGEICGASTYSSMVAVSGKPLVPMAWLNIGKTSQIGIFLPLSAFALHSEDDIPEEFVSGDGIQQYVDVKYNYASSGPHEYHCQRVREIQQYTMYQENLTFQGYDILQDIVVTSTNKQQIHDMIATYVNESVTNALNGYIHNSSSTGQNLVEPFVQKSIQQSSINQEIPKLSLRDQLPSSQQIKNLLHCIILNIFHIPSLYE